ncbi:MlaC/ttg2D family ABC transporter substrate-binding protein [Citreimonas salinaria]|uniref:Phospholipid transport system substrate-binding protein n=1 Tax=Citreimonas salinaria TaxID=321339 RepID=A0A1H3F2C1_9RHOB|nr:ABC transporter substrate-binding protein [Citreimonas salinaria]SDX85193.1 phospholipid transport system substrate-binding protein [Citreimonas salinaria]
MTFPLSRRTFCTLGVAAFALPAQAFALTDGEARRLVQTLVEEINGVIDSGRPESAMIAAFESIFARYADTAYVAAYALGADGRSATAAQKRAFSDAFNTYVARKYGRRFREFEGGRFEVQGVRAQNNYFEVPTRVYLRGEAPFDVTFLVSDRAGRPLFFNMYVEGVNMLLSERTEIGAMLDRRGGNIDALIADLRRAG